MKNYYSGTIWEKQVAYCRAKRVGNMIFVAGTTAVDGDGNVVGGESMYEQTKYSFQKAINAIKELGGDAIHVVRTRMFVTDISRFEEVARAHQELFNGIDPVASCLEITRLVDEKLLVEVEVDAIIE